MAPRTRSATSSPVKKSFLVSGDYKNTERTLPPQSDPLTCSILPKGLSDQARTLLLRHPRNGSQTRFLFCPILGLHEITKVSAPHHEHRSILLAPSREREEISEKQDSISQGWVDKEAALYIFTPFDLIFTLIDLLQAELLSGTKVLFKSLDDLLERRIEEDPHLRYVLDYGRKKVEEAMDRICESVEAGDEKMYKPSMMKLQSVLLGKVERMAGNGLPPSMEEHFVRKALERPMMTVKREESTISAANTDTSNDEKENEDPEKGSVDQKSDIFDSQAPTLVSESTACLIEKEPDITSPEIIHLLRQRTALNFLTSRYLPPPLSTKFFTTLPIDFTPLNTHLSYLRQLREEARASQSLSNMSRKRGPDDDEAAEMRADKQRKIDEEKVRKKNESHGVRALKKVDVKGMKKMSEFFVKKPLVPSAKVKN